MILAQNWLKTAKSLWRSPFEGATLRGFCGFVVQTFLKLVLGNLSHEQHYFWTSKGKHYFNIPFFSKLRHVLKYIWNFSVKWKKNKTKKTKKRPVSIRRFTILNLAKMRSFVVSSRDLLQTRGNITIQNLRFSQRNVWQAGSVCPPAYRLLNIARTWISNFYISFSLQ